MTAGASGTGGSGDGQDDDRLLGALYDDGGDAAGDELGGLRDLRSVFRGMRGDDAEPSDNGMAALLAAARQHAPGPKSGVVVPISAAKKGAPVFGQRLLAAMRTPSFAAAAGLLVVAGVAGTMYMHGETKSAETTASSTATMTSAEGAAPRAGAGAVSIPTMPAPTPPPVVAQVDAPAAAAVAIPEHTVAFDGITRGDAPKAKPAMMPSKTIAVGGKGGAMKAPELADADEERPSKDDAPGAMPAGSPKTAVTETGGAIQIASTTNGAAMDDKPAPADPAAVESPQHLYQQAQSAARSNDCRAVQVIATNVRKLDVAYYGNTFTRDASIATCLAPVAATTAKPSKTAKKPRPNVAK